MEALIPQVPGTRRVFAERTGGGYFLDFKWNRDQIARYGLSIDDVQSVVMSAVGGENVTTAVEGRERYPVNVRYLRDLRGDISGRDVGSYVQEAKKLLRDKLPLPPGYTLAWSGQYESMERVRERLAVVLPLTLFLILMLLYWNTKSVAKTVIIVLAVPFSTVGAIWFLHFLGYNMSIGVWVGLIALMGVDAETGVFMLLYLDLAFDQARREGTLHNLSGLQQAIMHGAVKRIRPKVMTVSCMFLGLAPIMWSAGTGADVMKRIAAPMIGGIFTSFLLELMVYPAIYEVWKWRSELKRNPSLA